MAEIFTSSGGETTRTVATELRLDQPADVYFGAADPGIAFYEKSGPDLNVTFLDGSSVLLRDFFVIGEGGGYNRLLNGNGGAEEITGLVAPEPLVDTTVVSSHAPEDAPSEPAAVSEPTPEPVPAPEPAPAAFSPATSVPVASDRPTVDVEWDGADGAGAGAVEESGAGDGHGFGGNGLFNGIGLDKLLFGAALVGTASLAFGDWSDSDPVVPDATPDAETPSAEEEDASTAEDDTVLAETDAVDAEAADAADSSAADAGTMDDETAAYVGLLLGDDLSTEDLIVGADGEAAMAEPSEDAMDEVDPAAEELGADGGAAAAADDAAFLLIDDGGDVLGLLLEDGGLLDDSLMTGNSEVLG